MVRNNILVKDFKLRLLCIFICASIIKCDEINQCPFIELLSFGSNIDIKCNETYLIFNETNNEKLDWKFINQSLLCQEQRGFVNECGITRINSKYLKVPLESLSHKELACIYCPINYKPIAPIINVTRSDSFSLTFNLTATGLAQNESFEILWAKRVVEHRSVQFWFSQTCIHDDIKIENITSHSIIFRTEDIYATRVEFIVRRCNGICLSRRQCLDEIFSDISSDNFQTPDSIEKVSCDHDCLNGTVNIPTTITTTTITTTAAATTTTTTTITTAATKTTTTIITTIATTTVITTAAVVVAKTTTIVHNLLSSSNELPNGKSSIKYFILYPLLGLVIVILFILSGYCIICKLKGLRTDNKYKKTSTINLDENKENVS